MSNIYPTQHHRGYATLNQLNSTCTVSHQAAPGVYNVPKICPGSSGATYPPHKDSLSHGVGPSASRYFNIETAYPSAKGCNSCSASYIRKPCGQRACGGVAPVPVPEPVEVKEPYCGCSSSH